MAPVAEPLPGGLPPAAYAAALAHLPAVGPHWLASALTSALPQDVWELVLTGSLGVSDEKARTSPSQLRRVRQWQGWAQQFDVTSMWARCQRAGISVVWPGAATYPDQLANDPEPIGVLFVRGDQALLRQQLAVAIIGTRECTPDGEALAFAMGYDLVRAGVCVVSGLARGIDGAAHAGAVNALREVGGRRPHMGTTLGVAASGVDVPYPRRSGALWREVADLGAVISEAPPGSAAQSWRFPSRNRVIASLVRLVVVVECATKSGSWHTIEAADSRNIEVVAVPGPVRAPSCAGTNQLLVWGARPVRHAADVLVRLSAAGLDVPAALGAGSRGPTVQGTLPIGPSGGPEPPLGPVERAVQCALSHRPRCVDELVERSGLPLKAVALALEHLGELGLAQHSAGWWSSTNK